MSHTVEVRPASSTAPPLRIAFTPHGPVAHTPDGDLPLPAAWTRLGELDLRAADPAADPASTRVDVSAWAAPELRIIAPEGNPRRRVTYLLPSAQGQRTIVGRGSGADIELTDPHVSRQHLELLVDNHRTLVRDLQSRFGAAINGQPLTRPTPLHHLDRITIGSTTLEYHCPWQALANAAPPPGSNTLSPVTLDTPAANQPVFPLPPPATPLHPGRRATPRWLLPAALLGCVAVTVLSLAATLMLLLQAR